MEKGLSLCGLSKIRIVKEFFLQLGQVLGVCFGSVVGLVGFEVEISTNACRNLVKDLALLELVKNPR